jgi:DNA helicase-2/ATP-dependent DNA helicase PcrA
VAEERRLLYVGVTRARQQVCLSWALARSPGGRPSRKPSRFLDGLRPGVAGARRKGYGSSVLALAGDARAGVRGRRWPARG